METTLARAQNNLGHAQPGMVHLVNHTGRSEKYKVGHEVVRRTTNLRDNYLRLQAKIRAQGIGPFKI